MSVLQVILIWWAASSVVLGLVTKFTYNLFLEHRILSTIWAFFAGPMYWVVIIAYWGRYGYNKL